MNNVKNAAEEVLQKELVYC